jgi:CYTH domain-containing protein
MAQEIERKFLVAGEFIELARSSMHMVQGYIATGHRTVRVRIGDNRAWLTIKGPSIDGGLSRFEWEKEIEAAEAFELLRLSEGAAIEKRRYFIDYEGHTFEVDEFKGANEGLIVAEVELSTADEAVALPSWIGDEVTGERCFYNSFLTKHPFKSWSK